MIAHSWRLRALVKMACAAGALTGLALSASAAAQSAETEAPPQAISEAATRVANWIAYSGDNGSLPYMIIDKNAATVFLFDAEGKSIGQAPIRCVYTTRSSISS